jgi:glycosyltransferase involved in cell wall biosynthesis
MSGIRLAILSTHPIQYHSAWFRALAAHPDLDVHVYYCHKATLQEQARAGFGVEFDWDVPLLTGYQHSFLRNVAYPPGNGRFGGFDTPEIKDIIRRREYDAVLVNGWHYKSAWQAIWACWQSKVRVMVRGDSHLHTPRSILLRLAKSLVYPRFIPRFDACLAVGQWSREYFLHYGALAERIFLVPHAVDTKRMGADSERLQSFRSELRKHWALDANAIVFMFAGKFIDKKRPMDFVRAVREAAARGASVQGLMVGDGRLRSVCENFVRAHHIPIRFAGFLNQSRIVEAYVAADVLVLPSDGGETWGLVVNEAMACKRPCVVSDRVGCGPDLVRMGETGVIFPLGDVDLLAALMIDLARQPSQLAMMGAQAQDRVGKYSVRTAVNGVIQSLAVVTGSRALHAIAD